LKGIHFFDVDGTIAWGLTGLGYLWLGARRGLFPLRPLLSVPSLLLKYRVGELSLDRFSGHGLSFLMGIRRADLEALSEEYFERSGRRGIYDGALSLIRGLQAGGEELAVASSSIDVILAPLLRYLGIDVSISTELECQNGICSGRFCGGGPVFGPEKRRRVLEYLEGRGIDPHDCHFYSDSIHDLPLLEAVGHPVAVNPDSLLRAQARARGWRELRFKGRGGAAKAG
jgi:HAD superfamily hydrolase (TIGR01490 family)